MREPQRSKLVADYSHGTPGRREWAQMESGG